jgi:sulfur carrier protein ThiS
MSSAIRTGVARQGCRVAERDQKGTLVVLHSDDHHSAQTLAAALNDQVVPKKLATAEIRSLGRVEGSEADDEESF